MLLLTLSAGSKGNYEWQKLDNNFLANNMLIINDVGKAAQKRFDDGLLYLKYAEDTSRFYLLRNKIQWIQYTFSCRKINNQIKAAQNCTNEAKYNSWYAVDEGIL